MLLPFYTLVPIILVTIMSLIIARQDELDEMSIFNLILTKNDVDPDKYAAHLKRRSESDALSRAYVSLVEPYEPRFWFTKILLVTQRIALILVLNLPENFKRAQLVVVSLLVFGSSAYSIVYQPYINRLRGSHGGQDPIGSCRRHGHRAADGL